MPATFKAARPPQKWLALGAVTVVPTAGEFLQLIYFSNKSGAVAAN
jgi:hypothetical protein